MTAVDIRLHFAHAEFLPAISTSQKPGLLSFLGFGNTDVTFTYPAAQRFVDQLSPTDMYDIAGVNGASIVATCGNPLFYDGPANAFLSLKPKTGVSDAQAREAFDATIKRVAGDAYDLDIAEGRAVRPGRPSIVYKLS